jgi:hypothetical protein
VAAVQRGDGGHIVAVRVPFDHDVALAARQCTSSGYCTSEAPRPDSATDPGRRQRRVRPSLRLSGTTQDGPDLPVPGRSSLEGRTQIDPMTTALAKLAIAGFARCDGPHSA